MFPAAFSERPLVRRMLVISGLSSVAITGPLLDLYGRNPEVFVANRTSPVEIIVFGLIIALAIPLLSLAILGVAGSVSGRVAEGAYGMVVGILAIATGFVVGRQVVPDETVVSVLVALAIALGVIALHKWMRGLLTLFAFALPVVLVMFVATSASARLVWAGGENEPTGTSAIGNQAPVILIQLDEFPLASIVGTDGRVNEALFPNFARLAAEGTWYRNALSDSIATTQSVPAILTGRLGEPGMSPSSIDHPKSLFTLLSDDYEMHVIEWVAEMCPEDICPEFAGRTPARFSSLLVDVGVVYGHLTLPSAARESLPSIDNTWKGFLGQDATTAGAGVAVAGLPVPPDPQRADWINWMQRIVNGIADDGPPILHYAHLKSPHVPWETNPSGTHYDRPEEYTEVEGVGGDGRWGPEPDSAMLAFQRHLYQVGFLDTMFGRLFERLDRTGTWDETMLIVVADHGTSFEPGEHRRWPYEDNRDDLYRVPLFIKYSNQATGLTVDEPVFGIDILPTVVDVLDISTDWEFDGLSLLQVAGTSRSHTPVHWCCSSKGASTDLSVLFSQVARNHQWIPDQSNWTAVAAVGSMARYVGRDLASLELAESNELLWSIDVPLDEVDRASGQVQTLVTGRVQLPPSVSSDEILVVLNGKVAGVGFITRDSSNGGTIRSLIAEDLVRDGANDVEILVSNQSGGWLRGEAESISLELRAADGHLLDLKAEGSRRIQVDNILKTEGGWRVEGWAADVVRKETPDTVYVFAGDVLVAWGEPNEDNRNVVRWFGSDDLLRSGFVFNLPGDVVPDDLDQLTVVAEFGTYPIGDTARIRRDP